MKALTSTAFVILCAACSGAPCPEGVFFSASGSCAPVCAQSQHPHCSERDCAAVGFRFLRRAGSWDEGGALIANGAVSVVWHVAGVGWEHDDRRLILRGATDRELECTCDSGGDRILLGRSRAVWRRADPATAARLIGEL